MRSQRVPDSFVPEFAPYVARSLTILVIDDDDAIRGIVSRVVRTSGHVSLDAHHGADALRVAAAHDGPIDLVITDMYMPGMRGTEVVEELQLQRPRMRAVYMSGYGKEDTARSGLLPGATFLQKPFNSLQIAAAIRAAMGDGLAA
jgi:two-component system, cell cycle sensor histidine kinase and response regulator CckA